MNGRTPRAARHLVHGLAVYTPFELSVGSPERLGTRADLVLERDPGPVTTPSGTIIAEVDHGPGGRRHVVSVADDVTVLTLTGTASVTFHADSHAVLRVGPAVATALLPVLVAGPVLVTAALLAGHDLLHASATLLPELHGAVAFVGPPGSGKSSLARLLSGPDRPLLSDDALRVDVAAPGDPVAHRGTTVSRLRGRAAELATVSAQPLGTASDGRALLDDGDVAPATAPLRAVVLPRLAPGVPEPRVVLVPRAAAVPLLASAGALEGVRDRGLLRRQLALAAAVARSVPVLELWVPWDTRSALAPDLADHLRTLLLGVLGGQR